MYVPPDEPMPDMGEINMTFRADEGLTNAEIQRSRNMAIGSSAVAGMGAGMGQRSQGVVTVNSASSQLGSHPHAGSISQSGVSSRGTTVYTGSAHIGNNGHTAAINPIYNG